MIRRAMPTRLGEIHDAFVRGYICGFLTLAGVIVSVIVMIRWVM